MEPCGNEGDLLRILSRLSLCICEQRSWLVSLFRVSFSKCDIPFSFNFLDLHKTFVRAIKRKTRMLQPMDAGGREWNRVFLDIHCKQADNDLTTEIRQAIKDLVDRKALVLFHFCVRKVAGDPALKACNIRASFPLR